MNASQHINRSTDAWRLLALAGAAIWALAPWNACAKGREVIKDAPIQVTFDLANAWDASANRLTTDNGDALVENGVDGTDTYVGRNANIWVDLETGSRAFVIDLSAPVANSANVKLESVNWSVVDCPSTLIASVRCPWILLTIRFSFSRMARAFCRPLA